MGKVVLLDHKLIRDCEGIPVVIIPPPYETVESLRQERIRGLGNCASILV